MMSGALTYLTWTAFFTAMLWVPYVLNMIVVRGLIDAVGYPENPKPLAPWAQRARSAHYNAVENLVVFAALVLTAQALGLTNEMIDGAAMAYFWLRVIHFLVYTFAIPWVRTLTFVGGWVCQVIIGVQILF